MGKNYTAPLIDADFEKWWTSYPKKVAKGEARKAWIQTAAIRPSTDKMIKAVIVACSSEQWTKDAGMFIPYPATWLRQERWDDVHEIELAGVVNGKMWWETVTGVDAKAKEHGLQEDQFESRAAFRAAVFKAAGASPLKMVANGAPVGAHPGDPDPE